MYIQIILFFKFYHLFFYDLLKFAQFNMMTNDHRRAHRGVGGHWPPLVAVLFQNNLFQMKQKYSSEQIFCEKIIV